MQSDVRYIKAIADTSKSKCHAIWSPRCSAIRGIRKDEGFRRQLDAELLRSSRVPVTLSYEAGEGCGVERNTSARVRLGSFLNQIVIALADNRAGNCQSASLQVEIVPSERTELSPPSSRHSRET